MNPKLVSITGQFAVGPEGITIGRDSSNTISLDDLRVSSHHCRIEVEGGKFTLVDTGSTNGTRLNGQDVDRAVLRHGDEIRLGMTVLRFLADDVTDPCTVGLEDSDALDVMSSETILLEAEEPLFFQSAAPIGEEQLQRLNRDLRVLLALSAGIDEIYETSALQEMLLERIFEVTPAESGAILLSNVAGNDFVFPAVSRHRVPGAVRMTVSRTIPLRVMTSGQSILRNDLLCDKAVSPSVAAAQIQSVLCVPLSVMGNRIGVVYLDTANADSPFDRRHMELVTAMASMVAAALEHLSYVEAVEAENRQLSHAVDIQHDMIGSSPAMMELYRNIARVATVASSVLILGETGTGKDLAAAAIHRNSKRSGGLFKVVNCGAITDTLFKSELFGCMRGAFTGADRDRAGLVEAAHGGTLFLDEIGEVPQDCQAALLRVIENGEVMRVGATQPRKVDVRVIAATNHSLEDDVKAGRFRADLLFRFVLRLNMPPLRERLEDIPALAAYFLQMFRNYTERTLETTPPDTLRVLREFAWPGNVRELKNAIEWAVVYGKSDRIRPADLPPEISQSSPNAAPEANGASLAEARGAFERQLILKALKDADGRVSDAAKVLGRARTFLERRITQLGLREELAKIRKVK